MRYEAGSWTTFHGRGDFGAQGEQAFVAVVEKLRAPPRQVPGDRAAVHGLLEVDQRLAELHALAGHLQALAGA